MQCPPDHPEEQARLKALESLGILDTAPEAAFDDLVDLASRLTGMPVALVSLVDSDRQWFKARHGLDASETPRDLAFCAHAVLDQDHPLVVEDARVDPRFAGNPLVDGAPHVICYAGIPIVHQRMPIGTLCVIDHQPRQLERWQLDALRALARQVERLLDARRDAARLTAALIAERRAEERFHLLFDHTVDAYFVLDPDYGIVECNEVLVRMLGLERRDQVLGRTPLDISPATQPDGRPSAEHIAEHRIGIAAGRSLRFDWVHLRGDGTPFAVEVRLQGFIHQGRPVVLAIWHDIAERQTLERQLAESEAVHREVVDGLVEAIIFLDLDGCMVYLNPAWARIIAADVNDTLGRRLTDFIQDEDRPVFGHMHQAVLAGDLDEGRDTYRFTTALGGVRWCDLSLRARRGAAGAVVGLIGTLSDVTDNVIAREETVSAKEVAEHSARAKADFLATMSHEIRTPLNGVIGMTSLLGSTRLDAVQQDYVETIRSCGESLLTIINDILDLSKLEAGKVELESIPFSPRTLVEDVCEILAEKAQGKGVAIRARCEPIEPPRILGDPNRIRQITLNLLSNAVKFTERGAVEATARIRADEGRFELAVRDSGIGIPEDRLHRLFQPFSQVDSSTTRRFGGSGLGLAICKHLAELMGGWITVESQAGQGSTFTLSLPLTAAPSDGSGAHPEALANLPVAVCSADEGLARQACDLLATAGATVRSVAFGAPLPATRVLVVDAAHPAFASDGAAAWAWADRERVAAIAIAGVSQRQALGPSGRTIVGNPLRLRQLVDAVRRSVDDSGSGRSRAPAAATPATDLAGLRVLVAEDNLVNQRVIIAMLKRIGIEADLVGDGQEALDACRTRTFDAVLMDCQMPVMDGFAAARAIRELPGAPGLVHIVALTANAMEGDRETCLAAGMSDYVAKPVRPEALVRALQAVPRRA